MPTLRQLAYLVAVADERHFGRAAQRANVSQPTLSAQFAQLESKLGLRLAERDQGGAVLTPLGREIADRARRVLADVQDIVDLASSAQEGLGGTLRLGVPPTLGPYLLPHIVPVLHARYRKLKLYVKEGAPRGIQDDLAAGNLDLLLTPLPIIHASLEVRPLFAESLLVAVAPDHPLAAKTALVADDLRGEQVLTLETGHQLHDQVRDLCDQFDAALLYDYEGTSLDTLRHMVGMGVGISFFPALYVRSEIGDRAEVVVLPLADARLSRDIGIAWRARTGLRGRYQTLADLIAEEVARILDDAGIGNPNPASG